MTSDPISLNVGTTNTLVVDAAVGSEVAVPTLMVTNTSTTTDFLSMVVFRNTTGVTTDLPLANVVKGTPFTFPGVLLFAPGDKCWLKSTNGTLRAFVLRDVDSPVGTSLNIRTDGPISNGKNYSVNDVALYNGSSYICSTAYLATSVFDSSKWTVFAQAGLPGNVMRYALGGGDGDNLTLTYDGYGRISTCSDTVEGLARSVTYNYAATIDVDPSSVVVVYNGKTRTVTFVKNVSGTITGTTTTEV